MRIGLGRYLFTCFILVYFEMEIAMRRRALDTIDFKFDDYEIGTERYIRASWQLKLSRFHILKNQLNDETLDEINGINHSLGISVIGLNAHAASYKESDYLYEIFEESAYPVWIWLFGVEALKDRGYAGWLRSLLSVRHVDNLRVVFVAESRKDLVSVFGRISEPLYQSTTPLDLNSFQPKSSPH